MSKLRRLYGQALALLWLVAVSGCDSTPDTRPSNELTPPPASTTSQPSPQQTIAAVSAHPEPVSGEPPPGSLVLRLSPAAAQAVTTLRVFAHKGSVIIRKNGESWVTGGAGACSVPAARMARALQALATLESKPTDEAMPEGKTFELQVVVMTGQQLAMSFDVAEHGAEAALVRLGDDSMHRVTGLDPNLWVANPTAWCRDE